MWGFVVISIPSSVMLYSSGSLVHFHSSFFIFIYYPINPVNLPDIDIIFPKNTIIHPNESGYGSLDPFASIYGHELYPKGNEIIENGDDDYKSIYKKSRDIGAPNHI